MEENIQLADRLSLGEGDFSADDAEDEVDIHFESSLSPNRQIERLQKQGMQCVGNIDISCAIHLRICSLCICELYVFLHWSCALQPPCSRSAIWRRE